MLTNFHYQLSMEHGIQIGRFRYSLVSYIILHVILYSLRKTCTQVIEIEI